MNVIEASNSNIFLVNEGQIYTPPLNDGCVNGIMRQWVSNQLDIHEKSLSIDDILQAQEIFLSNTIDGFISVKNIDNKFFTKFYISRDIQKKLINSNLDS